MTFRNILFSSKGPLHSEWIEAIAPALGSCRLLFSFKRFKKKSAICEDKVKKTVIFSLKQLFLENLFWFNALSPMSSLLTYLILERFFKFWISGSLKVLNLVSRLAILKISYFKRSTFKFESSIPDKKSRFFPFCNPVISLQIY